MMKAHKIHLSKKYETLTFSGVWTRPSVVTDKSGRERMAEFPYSFKKAQVRDARDTGY